MGPTQVQDHSPHLLNHQLRRHARRRLQAHQAPRPPPLRQALHDVPASRAASPAARSSVWPRTSSKTTRELASSSSAPRSTPSDSVDPSRPTCRVLWAAVIVSADPLPLEKLLFELVWTAQTILPDSEGAIDGHLREVGLTFHMLKDVPGLISKNIEKALVEAFQPLGISDYNSIFWIAHPGGPAILDQVEAKLNLKREKMRATWHVLSEYGNMRSASVLFILDEIRRKSAEDGLKTPGEGLEWGVLFGFGPGLTVETVVLHSVAI